jgi:hypothetical protein
VVRQEDGVKAALFGILGVLHHGLHDRTVLFGAAGTGGKEKGKVHGNSW